MEGKGLLTQYVGSTKEGVERQRLAQIQQKTFLGASKCKASCWSTRLLPHSPAVKSLGEKREKKKEGRKNLETTSGSKRWSVMFYILPVLYVTLTLAGHKEEVVRKESSEFLKKFRLGWGWGLTARHRY